MKGWYEGQNDGHDEITPRPDGTQPAGTRPDSFQGGAGDTSITADTRSALGHKLERYVEPPVDEDRARAGDQMTDQSTADYHLVAALRGRFSAEELYQIFEVLRPHRKDNEPTTALLDIVADSLKRQSR